MPMIKKECFEFAGSGGQVLPAVIWQPETVTAILQVTHGMTEHMGRYEDFAATLAPLGIAVAGFDLRGHGRNSGHPEIASCGSGGWEASLEDMRLFYSHLRQNFPGVPLFMLGFSLGSFLLREYLTRFPQENEISGAVIAGTGHQPGWLLSLMMTIVKGEISKAGFDGTTNLVRQLSFGTYNQKFKPNATTADWLCANRQELDRYLNDPLVRKDISAGLFWELLGSMKRTGSPFEYDGWDTSLPILLISGQDDPVGNSGKGVTALCRRMRKSGMESVEMELIPGFRHDLLHEGPEAATLILRWLESRISGK